MAVSVYRVNDQTVLEEAYDENYQPTEEGAYDVLYITTYFLQTDLCSFYSHEIFECL